MTDTTNACTEHRVSPPAGATPSTEWFDWNDTAGQARVFRGTQRGEDGDGVIVSIWGIQFQDGSVYSPCLDISARHHNAAPGSIDAAGARELAAHLLAAADELDELDQREGIAGREAVKA